MKSYDSLSTFPDVAGCLKAVSQDSGITAVVFSNGTYAMVSSSVKNSPDLAPQSVVFKDIVVVEDVKRFKPDPEVYRYLCKKVGKEGKENEVWLVSGNPFDVVGARSVGLNVAWVDRAGNGWVDSCVEGEKGRPSVIVSSLEEVVSAVRSFG
jgi:2-haloacid dehalogenase